MSECVKRQVAHACLELESTESWPDLSSRNGRVAESVWALRTIAGLALTHEHIVGNNIRLNDIICTLINTADHICIAPVDDNGDDVRQ